MQSEGSRKNGWVKVAALLAAVAFWQAPDAASAADGVAEIRSLDAETAKNLGGTRVLAVDEDGTQILHLREDLYAQKMPIEEVPVTQMLLLEDGPGKIIAVTVESSPAQKWECVPVGGGGMECWPAS